MKSKISRILGVGLMVAMLASMLVVATPASGAVGTLKFENIPLPKFGADGNYVLTPGTDVGPIAVAPDGKVMFASANITPSANITDVLKSSDGGYTWKLQTGFRTTADAAADTSSIVGIKVSPQFATDGSVFVATAVNVYVSVDGGVAFTPMATLGGTDTWSTTEVIQDFDVALDKTGRLSVIVGTANTTGYAGGVYAYVPATTGLGWKKQSQGTGWATPGTGTTLANVYAVAFSPKFASDEGIFAVVTGNVSATATSTLFRNSFGSTATGGGWCLSFTAATFRKATRATLVATHARIAFPDDFSPTSLTANIAFVGLSSGTAGVVEITDANVESGDVYKVALSSIASVATDLNIRGTPSSLTTTGTNIWSIALKGTAAAASIMVGTNFAVAADLQGVGYGTFYRSSDSGATWAGAYKSTGANCLAGATSPEFNVVMAPDYATSKVAWASNKGSNTYGQLSAVSRTTSGGVSWNRISLIDYGDTTSYYTVTGMVAVTPYATTQTLWLLTRSGTTPFPTLAAIGYNFYKDALWKTTNGGLTYEMVLSYANSITGMSGLATTADGAIFVYNPNSVAASIQSGVFWQSTSAGAYWLTKIYAKAAGFTAAYFVNASTIWTAYADGSIWSTTNTGLTWVKPDENIFTGTPQMFAFSGSIVLLSTADGTVFISTDAGKTFKSKLGVTNAGTGAACVSFDPGYATNKFVYCSIGTIGTPGGGIWRIAVNEAAPATTSWKRIDGNEANSASITPTMAFDIGGVFYCWDATAVSATAGGIWRSVNPRDDPDGLYKPKFETANTGLTATDSVRYLAPVSYSLSPNTLFVVDSATLTSTNYFNQLLAMADTLGTPVTLNTPADKAKDVGTSSTTESLYMNVALSWAPMTGATIYHLQVATDSAFVSKVEEYSTSATTREIVSTFLPGNTYYWRVRVGSYASGVTTGAPLISPWAVTRSFTMGVPYALQLRITSPASGATDVPVTPTFVWTALAGVTTYELVVSEDPTYAIINWGHTSDKAYYQTTDVDTLAYSTTYYWRVRAAGGSWVFGVFTTMAEPTTPAPPYTIAPTSTTIQVVEVPTTPAIPNYLLWIIIAIGAVLVIALIVLIVRTRRAA